jgi:hypothetical protein
MTMVLRPGSSFEDLVATPNASCPRCAGPLRRWGQARWRVVRDSGAGDRRFRPGRVRCARCGVTQVVLPAEVLVRRRDSVAVIGAAWRGFAGGAGSRRVAHLLGVPAHTVRGWLRRLKTLAHAIYGAFGGSARDELQWALAYVVIEAGQAGSEVDLWQSVAYRSQGRLLCNTSWP